MKILTFANLLKNFREEAGLSQTALAENCCSQVSRYYISKLESGTKPAPPKNTVLQLARGLNLSPENAERLWLVAKQERLKQTALCIATSTNGAGNGNIDFALEYLFTNFNEQEILTITSRAIEKVATSNF